MNSFKYYPVELLLELLSLPKSIDLLTNIWINNLKYKMSVVNKTQAIPIIPSLVVICLNFYSRGGISSSLIIVIIELNQHVHPTVITNILPSPEVTYVPDKINGEGTF
jgi:hypothetical protein